MLGDKLIQDSFVGRHGITRVPTFNFIQYLYSMNYSITVPSRFPTACPIRPFVNNSTAPKLIQNYNNIR